jgi:hypothetical protein
MSVALPGVQDGLYRTLVDIEERDLMREFLAERRVRKHGNVKTPYSPFLAAFTKGRHARVRYTLAKLAVVFALARAQRVPPEEFQTWRKKWPIEEPVAHGGTFRPALKITGSPRRRSKCS